MCACSLCCIEKHLLTEIDSSGILFLEFKSLMGFASSLSTAEMLKSIRYSSAVVESDSTFVKLFRFRAAHPTFVDSFLVLTFVPMAHRLIRQVLLRQPALIEDDVVQQTIKTLLQVFDTAGMRQRRTHFAFAISRAVKRETFLWAGRESIRQQAHDSVREDPVGDDGGFERLVQLRHLLQRALERAALTSSELDLLIEFKLGEIPSKGSNGTNGHSSNAQRQKLKRLLAKLREFARTDSSGTLPR